MIRLVPQSLFARLALSLLGVFCILHTGTVLTVADFFERHTLQSLLATHSASIATCVRLLEAEQGQDRLALMASLSKLPKFSMRIVEDKPAITLEHDNLSRLLLDHLRSALDSLTEGNGAPRELLAQVRVISFGGHTAQWPPLFEKFFSLWDISGTFQTQLAIRLTDGSWLAIDYTGQAQLAHLQDMPFVALALEFLALAILLLVIVHKLVQPLHTLAKAAEAFGASVRIPRIVPEEGPIEVRHAAQAFNTMRERICGVMEERERVFAALSHDLRTPLTRMRLRLESVEQKTLRKKLLEDARSLQSIVEMGTAFIRSERHVEALVRTDMQAFLEAIVEDRRAIGDDVRLCGAACRLSALIFPVALRRCLENLLDNAVRYGKTAELSARVDVGNPIPVLRIAIDDRGPGMPENMLERAFEPFFRVEGSRNRHTGGHGLGLAIAKSMARLHSAVLSLRNRPEGGLRACLELPLFYRQDSGAMPL